MRADQLAQQLAAERLALGRRGHDRFGDGDARDIDCAQAAGDDRQRVQQLVVLPIKSVLLSAIT